MVAHPRASVSIDRLRPLNNPTALPVQEDTKGRPVAVLWRGQRLAVTGIRDVWRIDDEWWRKEISRLYYQVVLASGRVLTLFRDLLSGQWFMQSAAVPKREERHLDILVQRSLRGSNVAAGFTPAPRTHEGCGYRLGDHVASGFMPARAPVKGATTFQPAREGKDSATPRRVRAG